MRTRRFSRSLAASRFRCCPIPTERRPEPSTPGIRMRGVRVAQFLSLAVKAEILHAQNPYNPANLNQYEGVFRALGLSDSPS